MGTQQVIVKNQGGIGLSGLLLVVFVTLKLCNVIAWPWLWVLSPIWIPIAIAISILALLGITALILNCFASKR